MCHPENIYKQNNFKVHSNREVICTTTTKNSKLDPVLGIYEFKIN